ncbi:hypothetical protein LHK12_15305 [Providencia rettgeri]|nr:hypothetical protein [Providencia rettgeri]
MIRIEPDANKLAAMQISIASINELLKNNHQNSAGEMRNTTHCNTPFVC